MTSPDDTIRFMIPLTLRKRNGRPKIMPPADYCPSVDRIQDPHNFIGGDQQVAPRNRHHAFRRYARGQHLLQHRRGRVGQVINPDDRCAFRGDKAHIGFAKLGDFNRLYFHALGVRPVLGIMANSYDRLFIAGARFVNHGAVFLEDGPATAAAFVVAFVGDSEVIGIQPFHTVGLTQNTFAFGGKVQPAVALCVDAVQTNGACAQVAGQGVSTGST